MRIYVAFESVIYLRGNGYVNNIRTKKTKTK